MNTNTQTWRQEYSNKYGIREKIMISKTNARSYISKTIFKLQSLKKTLISHYTKLIHLKVAIAEKNILEYDFNSIKCT